MAKEEWKRANVDLNEKSFVFFHTDENDHIFSSIRKSRTFYELELLQVLGEVLQPGDCVVDVGANIGNHAVYFAGVCGCRVLAFEPNPTAAEILRKNVEANRLEERIQVYELALGSQVGTGNLVAPACHNLGMVSVAEVEDDSGAVRIDLLSNYVGSDHIRLIKIDAEGMDYQVLLGAEEVIARDGCAVSIEAATRAELLKVAKLMERHGHVAVGSYNYTPTHLFLREHPDAQMSLLRRISRQAALDYIDRADFREALHRGRREANAQFEHTKKGLDSIASAIRNLEEQLSNRTTELAIKLSNDLAALQSQFAALLDYSVLAAEIENLQEAVQSQEQVLVKRDANVRRITFSDDVESSGSSALTFPSKTRTASTLKTAPVSQTFNDANEFKHAKLDTTEHEDSSGDQVLLHGSQVIADERFDGEASFGAWTNASSRIDTGGIVRSTRGGDIDFVTRSFAFEGGGIVELEIHVDHVDEGPSDLAAMVENDVGEGVGHDITLRPGITTFRAFAPARTRELAVRIVAHNCKVGASFKVSRLIVRRVESVAHQRATSARIGAPVLASMASIPSRRELLADAVNSLLAQCDRVRVFLNGYPDVPDFLRHPRVDVKRSQDWDDRGDAGKFFWLDHGDEAGYRLIVDDDLVFPPDFAEVMCAKVAEKDNKAIYATHGVILRQPIGNYYDHRSRATTFHFEDKLTSDRRVHIGATNALCMHSDAVSMKWIDFKYRNSADVWLALYAQKHNLQILTPARPRYWVRENHHLAPEDSIYSHSVNRTKTRFDSSLVQDAALKHAWPLSLRTNAEVKKYGLLLLVDDVVGLGEAIGRFLGRYGRRAEWVVMLAYNRTIQPIEHAIGDLVIDRETHLIDTLIDTDALTQARLLMEKTGIDAVLALDGVALVSDATKAKKLDSEHLQTFQGISITKLCDPNNAGLAALVLAVDDNISADLLRQIDGLECGSSSSLARLLSEPAVKTAGQPTPNVGRSKPTVNNVFERVRVLNLDHRRDRWEQVSARLAHVGIEAQRFGAIDERSPEVAAEYGRYSQGSRITVSSDVAPVLNQADFFLGYASQMARIAYLEGSGRKAIPSPRDWGYLKTYEAVLEEALEDGTESLLVFDDDILIHKDTEELFARAVQDLPEDWLILQFGTLQYNWSPPWTDWHSKMLYRTNGTAIGSHAVGMRFEIIPFLLDQAKRFDLPYDIGALSAATHAFRDRCYVIHPNLAVPGMFDAEVGKPGLMPNRRREEAAATYGWSLRDYR